VLKKTIKPNGETNEIDNINLFGYKLKNNILDTTTYHGFSKGST
jgi:hypothetical protein